MPDNQSRNDASDDAPEATLVTDIDFVETNRVRLDNEAKHRDQLGALKKKVSRSLDSAFGPAVDRNVI